MALLGRGASALLLVAVVALALIATIVPGLAHVGSIHVVDWVGLVIYAGAPVAWITAILHWARNFPGEGPRRLWGFVVVVGLAPGAVAYWLWGREASRLREGRLLHSVDRPSAGSYDRGDPVAQLAEQLTFNQ